MSERIKGDEQNEHEFVKNKLIQINPIYSYERVTILADKAETTATVMYLDFIWYCHIHLYEN